MSLALKRGDMNITAQAEVRLLTTVARLQLQQHRIAVMLLAFFTQIIMKHSHAGFADNLPANLFQPVINLLRLTRIVRRQRAFFLFGMPSCT